MFSVGDNHSSHLAHYTRFAGLVGVLSTETTSLNIRIPPETTSISRRTSKYTAAAITSVVSAIIGIVNRLSVVIRVDYLNCLGPKLSGSKWYLESMKYLQVGTVALYAYEQQHEASAIS